MSAIIFSISLIVVFCLGLKAGAIGSYLGLLDDPTAEAHKFHANKTPLVGSILLAAALVFLVANSLWKGHSSTYVTVSVFSILMGALGIVDDRLKLSWQVRFVLLWVIVAMLISLTPEMMVDQLHWSWGQISELSYTGGMVFTALCLVGLVIALNMMDGFNGGILSQGIVWSVIFAAMSPVYQSTFIYFAAVLSLIFFFNMAGKLFMGDGGAYALGLLMGASAIVMYSTETVNEVYADTIVVWLALPVFDCLRVIWGRKIKGLSPFLPQRDHLHHLVMREAGPNAALAYTIGFTAASGAAAARYPEISYLIVACQLLVLFLTIRVLANRKSVREGANEQAAAE